MVSGVDNPCLEALKARSWPGNARELRNVIERAVIVSAGPLITVADLPAEGAVCDRRGSEPGTSRRRCQFRGAGCDHGHQHGDCDYG